MARVARSSPRTGPPPTPERWIWAILAVAAVLRLIYLLDFRARSIFWGSMLLDAEIYDGWARRIAGGDWMGGDDVFALPPLYPYFLALVYKASGAGYAAVYGLQAFLGLANIYLVYSIGRKVFGGTAPLIAAGMATLYGSFMFAETKLMSTVIALTLGLGLMRLLLRAGERQTLTLWGSCGALLGVTALARPESLLFAPFAAWWIWRVTRTRGAATSPAAVDQYALAGRQPWFALSVFGAFLIIAVSPATMRNWVASNDWSLSNLISSQAGITFYQSNNERANGLYVFLDREGFSGDPRVQSEEEKRIAEMEAGRPLRRSEVTRHWLAKGLTWIFSNPARFFLLECRKLQRFLGSYEYSTEYIIYVERESVLSLWLAPLPFALISSLAIVGLMMQWKEGFRSPALLLVLFVASNFLVVMMFYVSSRYRMPSAPYLLLFAGAGVERLMRRIRSPLAADRTEGWIYGIVAVALFALLHVQVDSSSVVQEANLHYNAGNLYYNEERFDEAIAEYSRAVEMTPSHWRAWYNMGNALDALGRRQESIEAFRRVLQLNTRMDGARRRLQELGATP